MIYLDASILVPLFLIEAKSGDAEQVIRAGGHVVSDLACAEFSSAISTCVRTGRLRNDAALEKLSLFDAWLSGQSTPVEVAREDFMAAIIIVRRFDLGLRTPDALHLAVAQRLGAALATFDTRLAAAASAVGVPLA